MSNQDFITVKPTGTGYTIVLDVSDSDDLPYTIDLSKFNKGQLSLIIEDLEEAKKFARTLRGLLDDLEADIRERQLRSRWLKDIESHSLDAKEKQSQF